MYMYVCVYGCPIAYTDVVLCTGLPCFYLRQYCTGCMRSTLL